ncbi:hypothetical protein IVA87_34080 [Bradyrhizobium sp. 147]|uniref:hypothetical protein n=1 Tax=Bradyrhizobium sp. 147 TaxID=2782623 RepID=UPI001FF94723|nr:hypothetical protein [Bradyrhizobium sp. 147]MCK1684283.1 hypothetical protein [Bradyrhizobium sp. 147]
MPQIREGDEAPKIPTTGSGVRPSAQEQLDFLVTEARKALQVFARLPLQDYFRRHQEGDDLALAIEQASEHIASALHVLGKPSR